MASSQELIELIHATDLSDIIDYQLPSSHIKIIDNANIQIQFPFPVKKITPLLIEKFQQQLSTLIKNTINLDITGKVEAHETQGATKNIQGIKNIIAIASGKGGVGKSTTTINLALALSQQGASVGILDADIYGPSIPTMLGIKDKQPKSKDQKSIEPLTQFNLQVMSIGFLVDSNTAMVWRGPMVSGAFQQLLHDTQWKNLDYLLIDLPPGTGDIQLTLAQKVPVTAAIVVTTPQNVALADADRAIAMFNKVSIPILGVVENMSTHICEACGHESQLFGQQGGEKLSKKHVVSCLGKLPLNAVICTDLDNGNPTVQKEPNGLIAKAYQNIALQVSINLAKQRKNYSVAFPTIEIKN